ncbi:hypothetical protein [Enterovibrio norvegicus]
MVNSRISSGGTAYQFTLKKTGLFQSEMIPIIGGVVPIESLAGEELE